METGCPSENEFLARAAGTLSIDSASRIDAHVDVCADCRVMLAEAAAAVAEPPSAHAPVITFAAGEVVAERYVVIRWLATGGMGEVYEVHDTWIDENVALKTIVASIANDSRALARLKAEVRTARRVTHANVCRVYDLGFYTRDGEAIAFLTMELLRGMTLRQRLFSGGPLDCAAARPLIEQMAEALRHAHAAGIVHRDFKSDNVMLIPGVNAAVPRVVVMDFGLARQSLVGTSQPLTPQSRTVFGTLDYMSPEQVMGRPATLASDVYSLGIVTYELLTGRLPFEGESPLARALQRVTERAPTLSRELASASPDLAVCVARCLQSKPEARFATVEDFLLAFRGQPQPLPRYRILASVLIVLAVASTVVLVFASRMGRSEKAEPAGAPLDDTASHLPAPNDPRWAAPEGPALPETTPSVEAFPTQTKLGPELPASRPPRRPPVTVGAERRPVPPASPPVASASGTQGAPSAEPRILNRPSTGTGDALLNPFVAGPRRLQGSAPRNAP